MAQLRERNTGSLVNVPEEQEAAVLALGYYEKPKGESKTAAKKTAAKKSSK